MYEPKLLGADRVAGIDSQVIELDPKDAYRFAYKLWADKKTGLLLRAQTLDPNGQVLEQLSFSQIASVCRSTRRNRNGIQQHFGMDGRASAGRTGRHGSARLADHADGAGLPQDS